jgi:transcriptional regulator GlxA family with amidase domain
MTDERGNPYVQGDGETVGANYQYPELHDAMWLMERYWQERMSMREIAEELGCNRETVQEAFEREMIATRGRGRPSGEEGSGWR